MAFNHSGASTSKKQTYNFPTYNIGQCGIRRQVTRDEPRREAEIIGYFRPISRTKWEKFKRFWYNKEKQTYLKRTKSSWGKILFFYLMFFVGLSAFFSLVLLTYLQNIDITEPTYKLDSSRIGSNPGVGYRPVTDLHPESAVIWIRKGHKQYWKFYSDSMDALLDRYDPIKQNASNYRECSDLFPISRTTACKFDLEWLGSSCLNENKYGYDIGKPCVLIKLNKIWGWQPEPYTAKDKLPFNMPIDIKKKIRNGDSKIWITCAGENPGDKEHLGEFTYYPDNGLPTYYYPYENSPGYLAPLVMIQFDNIKEGILIFVECRAWAKNIVYSHNNKKGCVHFEILVDS